MQQKNQVTKCLEWPNQAQNYLVEKSRLEISGKVLKITWYPVGCDKNQVNGMTGLLNDYFLSLVSKI